MLRPSRFVWILLPLFALTQFGGFCDEKSNPIEIPVDPPQRVDPFQNEKNFEETLKEEIRKEELQGTDNFWKNFFYMLFVLGFIVSLIFAIAWFMKKMVHTRLMQENASSSLKILDKRSLSPKSMLYIIEAEGKQIILGESVNGITKLSEKSLASDFSISDQETQDSFQKMSDEKKT